MKTANFLFHWKRYDNITFLKKIRLYLYIPLCNLIPLLPVNIYISHIREFCALAIVLWDWNGFYHILTTKDVDRARGGASAEELTRCQELSDCGWVCIFLLDTCGGASAEELTRCQELSDCGWVCIFLLDTCGGASAEELTRCQEGGDSSWHEAKTGKLPFSWSSTQGSPVSQNAQIQWKKDAWDKKVHDTSLSYLQ